MFRREHDMGPRQGHGKDTRPSQGRQMACVWRFMGMFITDREILTHQLLLRARLYRSLMHK
jgi:hypothetical protein